MDNNKILTLLGFASKSRNLISGFDAVTRSADKGKVRLVIVAKDTSDNTREKVLNKCSSKGVKVVEMESVMALSTAIGKANRSVIGILDRKFAEAIIAEINK